MEDSVGRLRNLPRREFLSIVGLAALLAACGRTLSRITTTTQVAAHPPATTSPGGPTLTTASPTTTGSVPPATASPPGTAASTVPPAGIQPPPQSPPTAVPPPATAPSTVPPSPTTSVAETTTTSAVTTSPPATTVLPTTPPGTTTSAVASTTTTSVVTGPVTLRIEPRAAWGARDAIPDLLVPHSGSLQYLTVHHAGGNKGAQGIDRYQIWQNYHMDDKGWGDIAYHYIIHRNGTVYAARDIQYRGDTGTNYNTNRHFLVVVEGSFNGHFPTAAQYQSLPVVLAWGAQRHGISTDFIGGHRDYAATSCPGDNLYPLIADGTLKSQVDAILTAGISGA